MCTPCGPFGNASIYSIFLAPLLARPLLDPQASSGRSEMNGLEGSIKRAAAGTAALLALAACVSSPIPNEKIAVAKDSVQRAEQSGAQEFAPVELSTARDKLQRAEKAAADRDAQPATMLAEQADVDAQLAEATAQE